MRKPLILFVAMLALSLPAFATYFVIMKDGTQYRAKAKPTITKGVATFRLESGQMLRVDAGSIDFAKSDQTTKMGGGEILAVGGQSQAETTQQQPSLGSTIHLKKIPGTNPAAPPPTDTAPATAAPTGPMLANDVLSKFEMAFENVGIYEHQLKATGEHTLRADVTADSEERVFNALSATAFLIVHDAGVPGIRIDSVELFMKTTIGGSSGRFLMTRDDAQALDSKQISREEYFVRKVLY
ncbi:MAG TPA: hypothetical protein VKH35_05290 [Thermoanaerobaculia bacterium]|jgi:hypothetical protein|nr:hypothetical protein [Thermoanaerobaculia bacterium]